MGLACQSAVWKKPAPGAVYAAAVNMSDVVGKDTVTRKALFFGGYGSIYYPTVSASCSASSNGGWRYLVNGGSGSYQLYCSYCTNNGAGSYYYSSGTGICTLSSDGACSGVRCPGQDSNSAAFYVNSLGVLMSSTDTADVLFSWR